MVYFQRLVLFLVFLVSMVSVLADGGLVPDDAIVEHISGGHEFVEGPAVGREGHIYFSDIPRSVINRYSPQTGLTEVFREESHHSNGLAFFSGELFVCEHGSRSLTKKDAQGQTYVLADQFGNHQLNSPNDLAIDSGGGIYFTDPRYGNRDNLEQEIEAVYYLSPNGVLTRIIENFVRPNGIALSPQQATLYVSDQASNKIMAYDVKARGVLGRPRLFATFEGEQLGSDGMTVDSQGNLYATGSDTDHVWVFSPKGNLLNKIRVPENPSNVIFGEGEGRNWLYITARTSLYRVKLNAYGVSNSSNAKP